MSRWDAAQWGVAGAVWQGERGLAGHEGLRHGPDDGAAIAGAQGVGVRNDGDSATEEAVQGHEPQRLDGRGVSGGDNGEVGILGRIGLDGPVEVEQRVAREAEAGGEQVGEVGEVGGETHAIERGRGGDLARFEPGAGGGAKPDLRRGTGRAPTR